MNRDEAFGILDDHFILDGTADYEEASGITVKGSITLRRSKAVKALPIRFDKICGDFDCSYNSLESLENAPKSVGGSFTCAGNNLRSLEKRPQCVGKSYYCNLNPLAMLDGLPVHIGCKLVLDYTQALALLHILKIRGLKGVFFDDRANADLPAILGRYLGTGTRGMLSCAMEMIKAGFGKNAHL